LAITSPDFTGELLAVVLEPAAGAVVALAEGCVEAEDAGVEVAPAVAVAVVVAVVVAATVVVRSRPGRLP
jgi:prepilin signal peptidase PulO-like enzyme (type II secretory pathway)